MTNSMFACLPCDEEAEMRRKRGKKKETPPPPPQPKKEDQKKKNKNSLQSVATLSNKSKKKQQQQQQQTSNHPPSQNPDPDWQNWQERDSEIVDSEFQRNLEQALLLSRLEADQAEALRAIADADSPPASSGPSISKKKKKKNNSESKSEKTVPLATFLSDVTDPGPAQNTDVSASVDSPEPSASTSNDDETIVLAPHFATLVPKAKTYVVESTEDNCKVEGASNDQDFVSAQKSKDKGEKEKRQKHEKEKEKFFFEQVQRDVGKIIRKEECTEFLKNNEVLISEAVRSAQFRVDIEERDNQIAKLKSEIETLKEEFAKVKKRNKQLAFIISQGEMQEKAELLTEIDELKEVKDELTTQTVQLQQELEQEKTKNHKLAKEMQAMRGKGGKQASPAANEP